MTGSSPVDLSELHRQSPLAAIFLILRTIRSIGIIQIVIGIGFLLSQSPSVLILVVVALVIGVIAIGIGLLSWWRYTFSINGGELHVTRGILSQDKLTVPLDRVQSVSIEQKFLHRIVSLVQVSLDTAGTSAAEFTIDAVSEDVALALQRSAADFRPQGADSSEAVDGLVAAPEGQVGSFRSPLPTPDRVVIQHEPGRIIKMALTQMPLSGLAVLAPLVAFGDDLVDVIPFDLPEIEFEPGAWLFWAVPAAILAVVVSSIILNLISTLLRDWNLTLTRTDAGIRRDAGLLSRTSVASSIPRVQSIETSQGMLQRFVGLQNVTLHNIGDADVKVPGCEAEQIELVREVALDDGDGVEVLDRYVSSTEVFKAVRNTSIVMVLLGIGLFFAISWWSLLFLLPIPFTWLRMRRTVRLRRWAIDADAIADHREFLGWNRHEVLLRKANSVSVSQSLFERKRGLATVNVKLAGGLLAGGSFSVGMIPLEQATAVRDRVLYVVETDKRAYM